MSLSPSSPPRAEAPRPYNLPPEPLQFLPDDDDWEPPMEPPQIDDPDTTQKDQVDRICLPPTHIPDVFLPDSPIDSPRVDDTPPDSPKPIPNPTPPSPRVVPDPPEPQKPEPTPTPLEETPTPKDEEVKPTSDEKLEDEEALKPPSPDLPRFEFDDYESDEDDFLQQQPYTMDDRRVVYGSKLANAEEEKKFLIILQSALETYVSETGTYPTQMPIGQPSFQVDLHHLKAMARVLKDPTYSKSVKTFRAEYWNKLREMGLKWILNALHANPSVESVKFVRIAWSKQDAKRLARFVTITPHLKHLDLTDCTNDDVDHIIRAILKIMPDNKTLVSLVLNHVRYSETTFNMLLAMVSTNTTLEELSLIGTDFSYHNRAQRFMQALIDNPNTNLKQIHFPMMRGAVLWTAQMLQYNQSLTKVDLSRIALGQHAVLLQTALQNNKRLQSLDLRSTGLNDAQLAVLLEPLWFNSTLTHLNLSENVSLGSDSARNIAEMLMQNAGLTSLTLDSLTGIPKDKLARRLANALKVNSSIHTLSMMYMHMESAGATALGEALAVNHGLQSLNLSYNPSFDDACLNALIKGLKTNHGLHTLLLHNCKISDSAIKNLAPLLKTTSTLVQRLDLSHNKISTQSYVFLQSAISSNPLLKRLILGEPTIQPSLSERLTALRGDILSFFS